MFILIYNSAKRAEGGNVSVSVNRTKENPLIGKIADQARLLDKTYQEFPSVMPHTVTQEEDFTEAVCSKKVEITPFWILEYKTDSVSLKNRGFYEKKTPFLKNLQIKLLWNIIYSLCWCSQ